ncbi:methylated-DNA--[protein]-cysteine S-methyltransferase [Salmonella enterica subsp. enterica serovar Newport]|nr:methylated-DNA--[protein]-cysteine S-methyltransferase [Salmonella enterica subsp. enterica serovar Newport]
MYNDQLICPDSFPWRFANIVASEKNIIEVMFSNNTIMTKPNKITELCKHQLMLYFSKELTSFCLPIVSQGTVFSSAVYNELLRIPFGSTKTYKDIAIALGSPKKSRPVGHACSLNKISIIIPCHRVINSSGSLTGYAGGLKTKEWLINHES